MSINGFSRIVLMVAALLVGASAHAIPMSTVGAVDTFIDSADLGNSGDAVEEAWVESVLGFDVSFDAKNDSDSSDWMLVDGETDVYAATLESDPEYYLLKLGTGGTSLVSHYLFENIGELAWAVVDFSAAGIDLTIRNINVGRISHVSEFNGGGTVVVAEPSSIFLLGLGLAGLGLARRRVAK